MALTCDLLCCESSSADKCQAILDPVLLKDNRVLQALLETEEKYMPSPSYFNCVQTDIDSNMREIVAHWMLGVVHEENRQDEVFALSMNLLDRFLSLVPLKRGQLQLLGAVCLMLASKLKESPPLDAYKLVSYSEMAFKIDDLRAWELVVLSRLKWDLSAITPHAFLDQILDRLQLELSDSRMLEVRAHATFYIKVCATDSRFTSNPPSMVAAAAVASAIQSVMLRYSSEDERESELYPLSPSSLSCSSSLSLSSPFHPADRGLESLGDRSSYDKESCCSWDQEPPLLEPHSNSYSGSVNENDAKSFMQKIYDRLHCITQIDTDCLKECHRQIEIWTRTNSECATSTSLTPTDVQAVIF